MRQLLLQQLLISLLLPLADLSAPTEANRHESEPSRNNEIEFPALVVVGLKPLINEV